MRKVDVEGKASIIEAGMKKDGREGRRTRMVSLSYAGPDGGV